MTWDDRAKRRRSLGLGPGFIDGENEMTDEELVAAATELEDYFDASAAVGNSCYPPDVCWQCVRAYPWEAIRFDLCTHDYVTPFHRLDECTNPRGTAFAMHKGHRITREELNEAMNNGREWWESAERSYA